MNIFIFLRLGFRVKTKPFLFIRRLKTVFCHKKLKTLNYIPKGELKGCLLSINNVFLWLKNY
jgi:hypothetical protein